MRLKRRILQFDFQTLYFSNFEKRISMYIIFKTHVYFLKIFLEGEKNQSQTQKDIYNHVH